MEIHMKENGKMTKKMVKEYLLGQMEIHTKENGKMIKEMVKEYLLLKLRITPSGFDTKNNYWPKVFTFNSNI